MNTSIMYSTIALGLAATLYAAENPALNIETGGTLLLDDFEDGDLVSKYGPWKFSGDFASDEVPAKVIGRIIPIPSIIFDHRVIMIKGLIFFLDFVVKRDCVIRHRREQAEGGADVKRVFV